MIAEDVKWKNQVNHVVNKANRMLGLLKRTFESRDYSLWKDLCLALIRPHLEYAVKTWNPHLIGDIEKLELVQRRALKIPEGFENLSYSERLRRLKLSSLKDRRTRGDLIEMFKVQKGLEKIEWVKPPLLTKNDGLLGPASSVRGNSLRLRRESFKSRLRNDFSQSVTVRHNFFLNRVVPTWNSLPDDVVTSSSLNSFKSALDRYYQEYGCHSSKRVGFQI